MPLRMNSERKVEVTLSGFLKSPVAASVPFCTAKVRVKGLKARAGSVWLMAWINFVFRLGPASFSITRPTE